MKCRVGLGDDMEGSGMLEGALVVALVGTCLIHAWLAWTTRAEVRGVVLGLAEVLPVLKAAAELGDPAQAIEDVRDEITDTINAVLGSMRVPTGADHALGMLSSIGQMWAAQRFGFGGDPGQNVALEGPKEQTEDL